MSEKDDCKLCRGARGGVGGNENVVHGVVMCDYCHAALIDAFASAEHSARIAQAEEDERLAHEIAIEFAGIANRADDSFANGRCFGAASVETKIRDNAARLRAARLKKPETA